MEGASGRHGRRGCSCPEEGATLRPCAQMCPGAACRARRGAAHARALLAACVLLCSVAAARGSSAAGGQQAQRRGRGGVGDDGRGVRAHLNCSSLLNETSCGLRNGCAWCEGVGLVYNETDHLWELNETSCRAFQHCEGPPDLCELRETEKECAPSDLTGVSGGGGKKNKCKWCTSQDRCVTETPSRGRAQDLGQCMGCDEVFDSGLELDRCGVCGGGCVDTDLKVENPQCGCLGCDLVPFSGNTVDVCGVCGGKNETCSLFPVTYQEKVGVVLALCGNILISVSLNIQKYTHNLNHIASGGEVAYTDIPLWWTGMGLMVVGETGNFLGTLAASDVLRAMCCERCVASDVLHAPRDVLPAPPPPARAPPLSVAGLCCLRLVSAARLSSRALSAARL